MNTHVLNRARLVAIALTFLFSAATGWGKGEQEPRQPASSVDVSDAVSSAELGDANPFQPVSVARGVEFHSNDGNFLMNLRFRMQNRADMIFRQHPEPGESGTTHEWQVRRMRLRLNGHVVNPRLKYLLQLSFSRRDQDWDETNQPNILRDAMVMYAVTENWQVGFGQGKLPGNRQRVISSGDLQFVDRSIVNSTFNLDRDFGFQTQYRLRWEEHIVLLKGSLTSGEGRNRSVATNGQLFTVARVEWLPLGEFERNGDYFESDLVFERDPKLSFGYSFANMPGAARANGAIGRIMTTDGGRHGEPARSNLQTHLFDGVFKWQGYSLSMEGAWREASRIRVNDRSGWLAGHGINVQGGKMITEKSEVALRHSVVWPSAMSRTYFGTQRDWTVVYNHFLNGHRVKAQGEAGVIEGREHYVRLQVELGI